jgi:hypothetical protein
MHLSLQKEKVLDYDHYCFLTTTFALALRDVCKFTIWCDDISLELMRYLSKMIELFTAVPVGCVHSANPQALIEKARIQMGRSIFFLTTAISHQK